MHKRQENSNNIKQNISIPQNLRILLIIILVIITIYLSVECKATFVTTKGIYTSVNNLAITDGCDIGILMSVKKTLILCTSINLILTNIVTILILLARKTQPKLLILLTGLHFLELFIAQICYIAL